MEEKMKEVNVNPVEEKPSLMFLFCKKMLEDRKAISDHLDKGGELEDLKEQYNFYMPCTAEEFNERMTAKYGTIEERNQRAARAAAEELNPIPLDETDL
jgi:hypothetical protein